MGNENTPVFKAKNAGRELLVSALVGHLVEHVVQVVQRVDHLADVDGLPLADARSSRAGPLSLDLFPLNPCTLFAGWYATSITELLSYRPYVLAQ